MYYVHVHKYFSSQCGVKIWFQTKLSPSVSIFKNISEWYRRQSHINKSISRLEWRKSRIKSTSKWKFISPNIGGYVNKKVFITDSLEYSSRQLSSNFLCDPRHSVEKSKWRIYLLSLISVYRVSFQLMVCNALTDSLQKSLQYVRQ